MIEKKIIQKLATKYNLPLKVVEEIVFFQFKYVGTTMEIGTFESIRLPYFGKFSVKEGRVKHIQNKSQLKAAKNERLANDIK
jgi:nucleoid DNA-binding protein